MSFKTSSLWSVVLVSAAVLAVALTVWSISPAQQPHRRNAALLRAARLGQEPAIEAALNRGADANCRDGHDLTPLMYAARGDHPNIGNPAPTDNSGAVDLLLQRGADVNARTESGFVALFWAARYGHEHTAKLLIAHGADVTAKDKDGMTALKWAKTNGQTNVMVLLESAGAKE